MAAMLSVYNIRLRNIGRTKCIVCPTNPTVGTATALPAHYVLVPPDNPAKLVSEQLKTGPQSYSSRFYYAW